MQSCGSVTDGLRSWGTGGGRRGSETSAAVARACCTVDAVAFPVGGILACS